MMQLQMSTQLEQQVGAIIVSTIERLKCELVRIKIMEGGQKRTLQIMIERVNDGDATVSDCAKVSKMISPLLDVEDPISGEYDLEVSTPGIDRPLTRKKDFDRFKGCEVKVMTHSPISDRRKFTGRLLGIDEDEVITIDASLSSDKKADEEVIRIKGSDIASAKLILTDELLSMHGDVFNMNDNNNEVV